MDPCVYYSVCPCFVQIWTQMDEYAGKCHNLQLPCKLAQVFQMQEKFRWPTEEEWNDNHRND